MAFARPEKRKFGATILTPIPAPPTPNHIDVTPRRKILARDRLIKLAPSTDRTKTALARNQQTCTFFKLPAEIRSKIYMLALGSLYIRIEYEPHSHRIRQIKCKRYKEHIVGGLWCHNYDLTSGVVAAGVDHKGIVWTTRLDGPRRSLTLPSRTCRQMYADTALLHFEQHVFSFRNAWVMRKWMLQLRPVQKRALRRLDLARTDGIGVTLGKQLTGLHSLLIAGAWMDAQHYLARASQRKAEERERQDLYRN